MARRRRLLTALTLAGMAASGWLAVLASAMATQAKPAFTGYFPASQFWGNKEFNYYYLDATDTLKLEEITASEKTERLPTNPELAIKRVMDSDAPSKESILKDEPSKAQSINEQESSTRMAFYADKDGQKEIYKNKFDAGTASSILQSFDLVLTNRSSTKTDYLISFNWFMDPFDSRCNGAMGSAETDQSSNAACSWSWDSNPESVDFEKPEDGTIIAFNYDGESTPQSIWLASGSTVTFRTRRKPSDSDEHPHPPESEDVPAPLPALGAAAAFGMSRRLRRRLRRGETANLCAVPVVAANPIAADAIPTTPLAAARSARQHRQQVANRYGALLGGPRPL